MTNGRIDAGEKQRLEAQTTMSEKTEQEKYTKAQIAFGKYVAKPLIYTVALFRWVKDKISRKAI